MMFRFITSVMMIKHRYIMAISAFMCICFREFSAMNTTIYGTFSGKPIRLSVVMNTETPFLLFLSIFNFCINGNALSAFSATIFVKFRNWFGLLASIASFGYDWFRHGFLLQRKSCLEPVAAQTAIGSFYCNPSIQNNQTIITKLFRHLSPIGGRQAEFC